MHLLVRFVWCGLYSSCCLQGTPKPLIPLQGPFHIIRPPMVLIVLCLLVVYLKGYLDTLMHVVEQQLNQTITSVFVFNQQSNHCGCFSLLCAQCPQSAKILGMLAQLSERTGS